MMARYNRQLNELEDSLRVCLNILIMNNLG